MADNLDLNLLPLYRVQGQALPQIPGLLAVMPPKRTARGREHDRLLVYLFLPGTPTLSFAEYDQIIDRIVKRFYQTSGSLTSTLRSTVGEINQSLLKRNLQTASKGENVGAGRLILGVARGEQLLFAQCGPTSIFHITSGEIHQIHDEQIAGRGLGISQTTPLYFTQIDLRADDWLVLCPNLPTGWDATLFTEKNPTFESFSRKLAEFSNDDLNIVLLHAQAGKGNLNILRGMQPAVEIPVPAAPVRVPEILANPGQAYLNAEVPGQTPAPGPVSSQTELVGSGMEPSPPTMPTSQVESGRPASRFTRILSGGKQSVPVAIPPTPGVSQQNAGMSMASPGQLIQPASTQPYHSPMTIPAVPTGHPIRRSGYFVSPRSANDLPEIKRSSSRPLRAFFGGLLGVIRGVRGGTQKISHGVKKFTPTILPNSRDDSEVAGPSIALLAIVIPFIIVAIAATVYIHYGRTAQYQQYYGMALAQASQARDQTNPTDVRRAWDSTIYYLDLAEKNQKTKDSNDLRQQAQIALDNLDGILRLDFRPAILGGLSRSVRITHMVATDTDLYLLDSARGGVIRAFMTNQGYEVDPSFKCDPGQYETIIVEALIDLEVLPMSNFYNARILGMDGKGNLLYCGPAGPQAVSPVPPALGWRSISAFSLDSDGNNLYVLDPAGNAVWKYTGNFGRFTDLPSSFFGQQVPQTMNTAIDLAANNADLYMLFQDGHVTSCPLVRYNVAPMRCTDPITFVDTRPERKPSSKINDAIFTQMSFATAPDPSLYMLEPLTRAIYRFSPRSDSLELRGQFRATMEQNNTEFDGPATAMTISSNRYIFFSVGNQVYFATDVP